MAFGHSHAVVLLVLSLYLVHNAVVGMPRRAEFEAVPIQKLEEVNNKQSIQGDTNDAESLSSDDHQPKISNVQIPGRVFCEFEEATEVSVCQEYCKPKGYAYGICVSHVCNCV